MDDCSGVCSIVDAITLVPQFSESRNVTLIQEIESVEDEIKQL